MSELEKILRKEIIYQYDKNKQIVIRKDIQYREQDTYARMDLYEAIDSREKEKRPVVILVHGEAQGVQHMKETGQYLSWGNTIARLGIHAITFDHRMLSDGFTISDALKDIRSLVEYVVAHADALGVDENKMLIMSFSAGAPFGMYIGMAKLFQGIKGLISYYGVGDFELINKVLHRQEAKGGEVQYSIKQLISENAKVIPPILVVRSGLDDPSLNASMDETVLKMLSNNLTVSLINHEKGHHAFDLFDDNARSYEVIEQSILFIQRILQYK